MAARPRKALNPKSKDFGVRFGIHLRGLLEKRKLGPGELREKLNDGGLEYSAVTIDKWLSGDRLPRCHDLPVIGKALGLKDYRHVLPE